MGFIEKIEQIDRQLLFAINDANSPLFDTIMWWVSKPAFGIPFYLLFVFLAKQKTPVLGTKSKKFSN